MDSPWNQLVDFAALPVPRAHPAIERFARSGAQYAQAVLVVAIIACAGLMLPGIHFAREGELGGLVCALGAWLPALAVYWMYRRTVARMRTLLTHGERVDAEVVRVDSSRWTRVTIRFVRGGTAYSASFTTGRRAGIDTGSSLPALVNAPGASHDMVVLTPLDGVQAARFGIA